jgi:NADPH:quinone reductase-like Zn-dependent oxidoreductase
MARIRPTRYQRDLAVLLDMLRAAGISPLVAATVPLARAQDAKALLERGGVAGRIVIVPGDPTGA